MLTAGDEGTLEGRECSNPRGRRGLHEGARVVRGREGWWASAESCELYAPEQLRRQEDSARVAIHAIGSRLSRGRQEVGGKEAPVLSLAASHLRAMR